MIALLVAACGGRTSLDQVPIEGGTEAQVSSARVGLERFRVAAGPGRVSLRAIRFEDLSGLAGRYESPGVVRLDSRLRPEGVETVLIHEICHALDTQEALMHEPHEVFDLLGDQLGAIGYIEPGSEFDHPRGRRGEAMALLCEQEVLVAKAARGACPTDTAVAEGLGWLGDHVWTAAEDPVVDVPMGPTVFTPALGGPPSEMSVRPTEDPDVLSVLLEHLGPGGSRDTTELWVDRWTGVRLEEQPAVRRASTDVPSGHPREAFAVGFPEGPAWAVGLTRPFPWYEQVARSYVYVDGAWAVDRERCVLGVHGLVDVLEHHGELLYAWSDGRTVAWAPLRVP